MALWLKMTYGLAGAIITDGVTHLWASSCGCGAVVTARPHQYTGWAERLRAADDGSDRMAATTRPSGEQAVWRCSAIIPSHAWNRAKVWQLYL